MAIIFPTNFPLQVSRLPKTENMQFCSTSRNHDKINIQGTSVGSMKTGERDTVHPEIIFKTWI